MPYDTRDDELEAVGAAARKSGLINIAVGVAAIAAGLITGAAIIVGIGAGYFIGAVNISWLLRILRKGIGLDAQKAASSITRGYYVRFVTTCLVFFIVIYMRWVSPLHLIIGFSVSFFSIIGVLIYGASKTFGKNGDINPALKKVSKQRG